MWCGLTLAFPAEMDETAHFGLAHRVPTLHVTLTLMVAILSSRSKAGKNKGQTLPRIWGKNATKSDKHA